MEAVRSSVKVVDKTLTCDPFLYFEVGHPVVMKIYMEGRIIPVSHNTYFYVVRFYCNMFRLMYKSHHQTDKVPKKSYVKK
jgi:hypothetical protein